jgi:hypothetical protein
VVRVSSIHEFRKARFHTTQEGATMTRSVWTAGLALALGCAGPKDEATAPVPEGTSEGLGGSETGGSPETTDAPATTGSAPGTTTGAAPDSSGGPEGPTTDECAFICVFDVGDTGECDPWAQDCPEGEKCSAYANDGGTAWNDTKCVGVAANPGQPGDACSVEGSGVSGIDSCDVGAMCWDVDAENEGVCVALCTGSPEAPVCDGGFGCAVANDVLNLCLSLCDPLAQDCPGDDLCVANGDQFLCVLDASGDAGQAFDPCEFANACDAGLLCVDPGASSECDVSAGGCCSPLCDLDAPSCPGADQQCLPWFEEGSAPPGFEQVGICAVPG